MNTTIRHIWLSSEACHALNFRFEMLDKSIKNFHNAFSLESIQLHNDFLFLKFFLEQGFIINTKNNELNQEKVLSKIIERDFKSIADLKSNIYELGIDNRTEWIIMGLSFADFRFHLFPIYTDENRVIPFCVSPVMSCCFMDDIINLSELSRENYIIKQVENLNWKVIESRTECLQLPLDLFDNSTDCLEDIC